MTDLFRVIMMRPARNMLEAASPSTQESEGERKRGVALGARSEHSMVIV
jgi:hypothetical protein